VGRFQVIGRLARVVLEGADFDDQAIEAHGDPADQTNES
jgi:hypothetical protein